MATWRNSPELTNNERLLIHEGLYTEVAPGHVIEADLAGEPALRANQLLRHIPRGHIAVTFSACWIFTGWWPPGRMREVYAAHPKRTKPPAVYRHAVPEEFTRRIGGLMVTSPARTAVDLLLLEPLEEAMEGLLQLYGAHLTMAELRAHVDLEARRKKLPMVREIVNQFADYATWRRDTMIEAVREAAQETSGATSLPGDDHPSSSR